MSQIKIITRICKTLWYMYNRSLNVEFDKCINILHTLTGSLWIPMKVYSLQTRIHNWSKSFTDQKLKGLFHRLYRLAYQSIKNDQESSTFLFKEQHYKRMVKTIQLVPEPLRQFRRYIDVQCICTQHTMYRGQLHCYKSVHTYREDQGSGIHRQSLLWSGL